MWVQHSDDDLPRGSDGWQYVPELTRQEPEPLVHKGYGDSLGATDPSRCWPVSGSVTSS